MTTFFKFFAALSPIVFGALPAAAQPLRPGDHCPDVALVRYRGNTGVKGHLFDGRPELTLVEFWSSGCSGCLHYMPILDSLQKNFGSRLQVISVNKESPDSLRRFFARHKKLQRPATPFTGGEGALGALFPHSFTPWVVWIDQGQVVRYITSAHNVSAATVTGFLEGRALRVDTLEYVGDFDGTKPLIAEGNGRWLPQIPYYSYLARCLSSVSISNYERREEGAPTPYGISRNCASLLELLKTAYSEGGRYDFSAPTTIALEVADSGRYRWPSDNGMLDAWKNANAYSYEIRLPKEGAARIYRMMQGDISEYFGLDVKVEKRVLPALVLVQTGPISKLQPGGGPVSSNLGRVTEDSVRYLQNEPFSVLVANLRSRCNYRHLTFPLVDATGLSGPVTIRLPKEAFDGVDLPALHRALAPYGLDLREQPAEVPVLDVRQQEQKKE